MRILVTGGTGFLGCSVVENLRKRGADVFICSRSAHGAAEAEILKADLLDPAAAEHIVARTKPEIVLHAAWNVERGKFWDTPDNLDWTGATLRLAQAAAKHGVRRFVGVGTCFEYDWPAHGNCAEATTPLEPSTLYAVAKDATRRIVQEFAARQGLEFSWARLFYLFGPREQSDRLVASVALKLAHDEPAPLSSGTAVRDFMDVRDAGAALAALVVSRVTGAVNIGSGNGIAIADLAKLLQDAAGKSGQLQIGALPDRPGEAARIVADIGRLHDEVGYRPSATIEQRLAEAYRWWQEQLTRPLIG